MTDQQDYNINDLILNAVMIKKEKEDIIALTKLKDKSMLETTNIAKKFTGTEPKAFKTMVEATYDKIFNNSAYNTKRELTEEVYAVIDGLDVLKMVKVLDGEQG